MDPEEISVPAVQNPMNNHRFSFPLIIGGFLLLCLVAMGAYYLGTQNSSRLTNFNSRLPDPSAAPSQNIVPSVITRPIPTPTTAPVTNNLFDSPYELASGCDGTVCLFANKEEDVVEGFASLQGYYRQYQAIDWGDRQVTCDSLLVTGGNKALIDSFKKQIDEGNGINKYDAAKNLLVNINISGADAATKKKILSSSVSKSVEIGVIRKTPQGRSGSTCFSFVDILYAK